MSISCVGAVARGSPPAASSETPSDGSDLPPPRVVRRQPAAAEDLHREAEPHHAWLYPPREGPRADPRPHERSPTGLRTPRAGHAGRLARTPGMRACDLHGPVAETVCPRGYRAGAARQTGRGAAVRRLPQHRRVALPPCRTRMPLHLVTGPANAAKARVVLDARARARPRSRRCWSCRRSPTSRSTGASWPPAARCSASGSSASTACCASWPTARGVRRPHADRRCSASASPPPRSPRRRWSASAPPRARPASRPRSSPSPRSWGRPASSRRASSPRCAPGPRRTRAARAFAEELGALVLAYRRDAGADRPPRPPAARHRRARRPARGPRALGRHAGLPLRVRRPHAAAARRRRHARQRGRRRGRRSRSPSSPAAPPSPPARRCTRSCWRSARPSSASTPSPTTTRPPPAALHHVERALYEPDARTPRAPSSPAGERCRASRAAASAPRSSWSPPRSRALIREDGVAPEEIAVVHRGLDAAAPLIDLVFRTYDIPAAVRRTIKVGHTALGRGLVAMVRCALLDASADELLAWLRTPGVLRTPAFADRLEARARREGARTAPRGARAVGAGALVAGGARPPRATPTSAAASEALAERVAAEAAHAARRALPRAPRRSSTPRASWTRASPRRSAARCASWPSCRPSCSPARPSWPPRSTTSRSTSARSRAPAASRSPSRSRCAPAASARCSASACRRASSRRPPGPSRSWATTSAARSTPPPACGCACTRTR